MKNTNKIVAAVVVIVGVSLFLNWSVQRDRVLIVSSIKYEQCVQTLYGTTPSAWYALHGRYPVCDQIIQTTE